MSLSGKMDSLEMDGSMNLAVISSIASGIIGGILAFFVALLPERIKEREPFFVLQSNFAHVVSGIAECVLGLFLFVYGYNNFVGGLSTAVVHAIAGETAHLLSEADMGRMGVYSYILYLMHPVALISLYMFMEGSIRAFAAGFSGRCHGIGFLWLIDRILLFARAKCKAAILRHKIGPYEPDSAFKDESSGALILTSLENKPWQLRQIARHGEDFFILAARDFVPKGRHHRHQYTFRPLHPGEIIRGTVIDIPFALRTSRKPSFETKNSK
jgi:hypothetical protein